MKRTILAAHAAVLGLCSCTPPAWAQDDEDNEIVVTGALERGSVRSSVPAEIRVDRVQIIALGADSLAEVIGLFGAQTRGTGTESEPILLLDGRRIGNRSEIDQLPPEAILRIEIFPEQVALQYGYPPDRRVVNVILRPKYHAVELQARIDVPLGEGRANYRASAGLTRLASDKRLNLDLSYRRQAELSDRANASMVGERWRLPRTDRLAATGSYAGRLGDLAITFNPTMRWLGEQWQLGDATAGLGLRRKGTQTRGGLGATVGDDTGQWSWLAAASLALQDDRVETREGTGMPIALAGFSTRAVRREAQFDLTASGPLGHTSNGQLRTTIGAGFALHRSEARDAALDGPKAALRRDSAYVSGSLEIPFVSGDGAVAFGDAGFTATNSMGVLARYGLGLRGSPLGWLAYSASYSRERSLPLFDDLAAIELSTPNVLAYDFASGDTAFVERIEGGNPALISPTTRTLALRLQLKPLASYDFALSFDYTGRSIRDGVSGPLGPTPQVEAAFPERSERDLSGTLVRFDARPANIAREDRQELRWGASFTAPTGPVPIASGQPAGGELQLAFYHTWTIEDAAALRVGSPRIDLLQGAAIGNLGGTPRHRFELQLGYATRQGGIRLTGHWSSPSEVDDPGPGGHRLRFERGATIDLRLFVNLGAFRERLGLPPVLDGRLYLALDNLLGSATRIRDETGRRIDYYRGPDEEAGRAVRLAFRKMFY